LPAVAAACSGGTGSVNSPTTNTTSGSGTTSGSTSGTSGTTGETNFCTQCEAQGLVCDQLDTTCVTECDLCGGCEDIVANVDALDGGFSDGGLPLDVCNYACPDPDGSGSAGHTVGWTVLACQQTDCPDEWPDGGAPGPLCVDCTVQNCNGAGRLPQGLTPAPRASQTALQHHFSQAAWMEAASALAFEQIAQELERFGAPRALIRRARAARRDELRHAEVIGRWAERYGGAGPVPAAIAQRDRSLEDFASENAREGCVRETFGAAVAAWQAAQARDPVLREALGGIASDELRHAELSWDIASWAERRLDEPARRRVAAARAEAVAVLKAEGLAPREAALVEMGLLPDVVSAERLLEAVDVALWRS
jgi:hypothetical protein